LLARLTSSQISEWIAYCKLLKIGPPPIEDPKAVQRAKRAKIESGMRALMLKQEAQKK